MENFDILNEIKTEVACEVLKDIKECKKEYRTRNFACIVYPESAPNDWENILIEEKIQAFISPLHDKDINADGEPKKPHYHLIIMFDSVKTFSQAREVFKKVNGVGCEVVKAIRGYARYLCHLDNPEKARYNTNSVRSLCGADYISTINLITDRYFTLKEIVSFCEKNSIYSYRKLVKHCSLHNEDWFRVVCDNTVFLLGYLKSMKFDLDCSQAQELPEELKNTKNWLDTDLSKVESL